MSGRDGEALTELLHSKKVKEILSQDTEEEEQAKGRVGNDEVREYGMGMAAGTDEAQDAETVACGGTVYKIDKGTVIIGMDAAGAFGATAGACLKFWAESFHEEVEQGFR